MGETLIPFGISQYISPLSPDRILSEMQQMTSAKRWFRNPFASLQESFEGELDSNGFDIVPLPQVRSNRPIPRIKGRVVVNAFGKTEVSLELLRPGVYVLAGIMFGLVAGSILGSVDS